MLLIWYDFPLAKSIPVESIAAILEDAVIKVVLSVETKLIVPFDVTVKSVAALEEIWIASPLYCVWPDVSIRRLVPSNNRFDSPFISFKLLDVTTLLSAPTKNLEAPKTLLWY